MQTRSSIRKWTMNTAEDYKGMTTESDNQMNGSFESFAKSEDLSRNFTISEQAQKSLSQQTIQKKYNENIQEHDKQSQGDEIFSNFFEFSKSQGQNSMIQEQENNLILKKLNFLKNNQDDSFQLPEGLKYNQQLDNEETAKLRETVKYNNREKQIINYNSKQKPDPISTSPLNYNYNWQKLEYVQQTDAHKKINLPKDFKIKLMNYESKNNQMNLYQDDNEQSFQKIIEEQNYNEIKFKIAQQRINDVQNQAQQLDKQYVSNQIQEEILNQICENNEQIEDKFSLLQNTPSKQNYTNQNDQLTFGKKKSSVKKSNVNVNQLVTRLTQSKREYNEKLDQIRIKKMQIEEQLYSFKPQISVQSQNLNRSVDDLFRWKDQKEYNYEKQKNSKNVQEREIEQSMKQKRHISKGSLRILNSQNRNSRDIGQYLIAQGDKTQTKIKNIIDKEIHMYKNAIPTIDKRSRHIASILDDSSVVERLSRSQSAKKHSGYKSLRSERLDRSEQTIQTNEFSIKQIPKIQSNVQKGGVKKIFLKLPSQNDSHYEISYQPVQNQQSQQNNEMFSSIKKSNRKRSGSVQQFSQAKKQISWSAEKKNQSLKNEVEDLDLQIKELCKSMRQDKNELSKYDINSPYYFSVQQRQNKIFAYQNNQCIILNKHQFQEQIDQLKSDNSKYETSHEYNNSMINMPLQDRCNLWMQKVQTKNEQKRNDSTEKQIQNCTFKPKISKYQLNQKTPRNDSSRSFSRNLNLSKEFRNRNSYRESYEFKKSFIL